MAQPQPTAPVALPPLTGATGLTDATTTVGQQKANFSGLWSYLAYLFSQVGTRTAAFNTVASEGGAVGGALGVTGNLYASSINSGGHIIAESLVSGKSLYVQGDANGGIVITRRDDWSPSNPWLLYGAAGALRIWSAAGDRFWVDDAGNAVAAGNISIVSDERHKSNIETLAAARSKILASRGVSFTRNDSGQHGVGVIAQEALKIIPELVHEESDGTYSVRYLGYVPYLIETIKEQDGMLTAHEEEIAELRRRVSALEQRGAA